MLDTRLSIGYRESSIENRGTKMKHIISALVENKPGVLAHVAGMFAARAFNIDSLVVGRTEDPELSRMTIVVVGDDKVVEQVRKQLAKVVQGSGFCRSAGSSPGPDAYNDFGHAG
jgi:acetolactate synthase regulatory subunit